MRRRGFDIPLNRDGSGRFLPWLIALMVYLAGLALAGTLVLNGALQRWDRSLVGTLTVQLPPAPTDPGKGDGGLAAALQLLRITPGVVSAEPLSGEAVSRLVEPWLGNALTAEELALPRLIDLRIDLDQPPDLATLKTRLAVAASGAVLDDHRAWFDRLALLMLSIEVTTLGILALIG
ncbi:MAG TPA: cell division protein, partial [Stellaceae bacterium]